MSGALNLELAWAKVRQNRGAGGVDGQSIAEFEEQLDERLQRLQDELRAHTYRPQPVLRHLIPKAGQPGKHRPLGIPTIYDRDCQQALLNRLEPIFDPVLDDANFGYRRGRSTKDALRKIWREIQHGREWIVDADLRDFFGTVDHEKLGVLVNQRVSDGRVLQLITSFLKAGCIAQGARLPTAQGTPQGGVVSPLLSSILLTPFDREMRRKGYHLTRYADDWVVTCRTRRRQWLRCKRLPTSWERLGSPCIRARRVSSMCGTGLHSSGTRSSVASVRCGCAPTKSKGEDPVFT